MCTSFKWGNMESLCTLCTHWLHHLGLWLGPDRRACRLVWFFCSTDVVIFISFRPLIVLTILIGKPTLFHVSGSLPLVFTHYHCHSIELAGDGHFSKQKFRLISYSFPVCCGCFPFHTSFAFAMGVRFSHTSFCCVFFSF